MFQQKQHNQKETPVNNKFSLVLFMIIIGSSNPVAIKYALNYGWPPLLLGIFRMSGIGLFVLLWLKLKGEPLIGPDKNAAFYSIAASVCKGIGVIGFYLSLSIMPASRNIILATFSPVVNLLMIHLILEHENIRKNHILGITISFIGIFLLLFIRNKIFIDNGKPVSFFVGDILMIVSIVFHNAMVIFEKKAFMFGAKPRQLIIWNNLVSILVFSFMLLFIEEKISSIPANINTMGIFIYLVTIVGIFLFYYRRWLVLKLEVSYINSFSHLGKALSMFYAVLFLGETISFKSILCFILIFSGTLIATRDF